MYTRPRSNPSYPNVRNPIAPNVGYTGQSAYPQGSFPPPQSGPNQPVNYKPGVSQNSPLRAPQHTSAQIMQPRSMPLHVKSQPPQNVQQPNMQQQNKQQQNIQQQQQSIQQQQQQNIQQQQQNIQQQQQKLQQLPQQQQQQQQQPQQLPQQIKQQLPATNSPQTPKLKPILKPSLQSPQQPLPSTQNNPTTNQPSIPIPQPVPAPTPAPTSAPAPVPPPTTQGAIITNNPSDTTNTSETSESMDIETLDQPKWRRKAAGAKTTAANRVNKRLKRLRLNQRLRKTLQPKNAIMVLNEMKAGVQFTFPATQGSMPNSLHVVHAEVGGKTYVGQGLSRSLARQSAAENALKALLLEKMTAVTMKFHLDNATDSQLGNGGSYKRKRETKDTATETNNVVGDDANEIPWSSLASFALYKLFLEWHNQGISVPVSRPGLPTTVKSFKPEPYRTQKPSTQKELPPNATSIHPVMLLNQMRPGLVYVEKSRTGNPPNTMFTLAVKIDDIEYTGTAKNKKDAKKVAAKSALLALYDLIYPDETKPILREQVHSPEAQMA